MEYVNWAFEHYGDLIAIALGIHGVALLIVNLTPSPKDNEYLAYVYKGIEFLSGLVTQKAKQ